MRKTMIGKEDEEEKETRAIKSLLWDRVWSRQTRQKRLFLESCVRLYKTRPKTNPEPTQCCNLDNVEASPLSPLNQLCSAGLLC